MTILHISNKPVFPSVDGGCFAMARLLESLHQVATSVEHVCLNTAKHPFIDGAYPDFIRFALDPKDSFLDTELHPMHALKALLSRKNYNLSRFYDVDCANKLKTIVSTRQYDCILFESIYSAVYLNDLRTVSNARMIIRTHNVEHELWTQQADSAGFLKKSYLRSLAKSLRREEIQLLQTADAFWTITAEDQSALKNLGITTHSALIRVAVHTADQPATCSDHFFHLGSMNWEPNRKAAERLLHTIWPAFYQKHPSAALHLAGTFFSEYSFPETEGVVFHGTVAKASDFMQSHGSLVAPIVSGSGVRIKLLEAMSSGIPCITTKLGATGVQTAEAGTLIAETMNEWLDAMHQLNQSATLRSELGEKARRYMEKYHSFTAINEQILQELEF